MSVGMVTSNSYQMYKNSTGNTQNASSSDQYASNSQLFDTSSVQQGEKETYPGWNVTFNTEETETFYGITGYNLNRYPDGSYYFYDGNGNEPTGAKLEMLTAAADYMTQAKQALFEQEGAGCSLNSDDITGALQGIVASFQDAMNPYSLHEDALANFSAGTDVTSDLLETLDAISANSAAATELSESEASESPKHIAQVLKYSTKTGTTLSHSI
ncbi:hypothetical protein NBH19_08220 [Rhizobium sp. S95]|uniref:Uncharacterized protein n=1 Tax=Ciceribacter sichuanensis TaxID=2949647 RepID=A0AAJ1C172_9HYPH|nr:MULTISPECIES: hypothetical protein [unclassified Ciceribacter]MCM2396064.1 hypothetical protein [Ciceribacter sp. S95]MCO5959921.1 hypothetical protein [Ciceribacter sp. S101]